MIAQVASPHILVKDYLALTKPRIIVLLLFTALGGMFLASKGMPDVYLMSIVLVSGTLASGGANALNHSLDRDIDAKMRRTSTRPVADGRIRPYQAILFGTALNVLAFVLLSSMVNPLSAVLTASATLFYVFVYTKALKRTTPQNIVIGGAAGAFPPMIGWAAVTGGIDLPAVYMFAIIFFWTPPHFWALSLILKEDYARAGVPMLPVVAGVDATKKAILRYTFLLVALTLIFVTTRSVGWAYLGTSSVLGVGFIYFALRLARTPGILGAKALYLYSLAYLAVLFLAIMVDSLV